MSKTTSEVLRDPAELGRGMIARGLAAGELAPIEPEGGAFGAGLIRGFAVITRGEALGHCLWIDAEFLQQVTDALNALKGGPKARFTHPGLSADGLGKHLGRAREARVNGDTVYGDLHLSRSAHSSPDGNLAAYVMGLAQEDPGAFGASIVFAHDWDAEDEFENANLKEVEENDWQGRPVKRMRFRSPDPDNVNHYRHCRLAELRAVDVVDDPAANPQGLFRRGDEIADDAESLLSFALGLTKEAPSSSSFDVHPQRVQSFVTKFLERHGLSLVTSKEDAMSTATQPTAPATPAAPTREQFTAELKRFTDRFGAKGSIWFAENKTWEQALESHAGSLEEQLRKKDEELAELKNKFASIERGEEKPLSSNGAGNTAGQKTTLANLVNLPDAAK